MMVNALIINDDDNIAVAIEKISKGSDVDCKMKDGTTIKINARDDIQIYHKIAIKDVSKDSKVVKYGQYIGIAADEIKKGEHVHEHNVISKREN